MVRDSLEGFLCLLSLGLLKGHPNITNLVVINRFLDLFYNFFVLF